MKIKTTLLTALCCLLASMSFASGNGPIKGNKKIVTQTISITDYNAISVTGAEIIYEQSNAKPYFEITIDENILPYIEIGVENRHLKIRPKYENEKKKITYNISPTKFIIKTNSTDLRTINNTGSGDITINSDLQTKGLEINSAGSGDIEFTKSFIGEKIKIDQAGSGNIKIKNIEADKLDYNVAGSGSITVAGRVYNATYGISGSGNAKALECISDDVKVSVSGSGDVQVAVNTNLDVSIAGSGNVKYKGNPKITNTIQGSGSLRPVN